MNLLSRRQQYYFSSFLKHDLKASITVFFVALPLCLGISLASGAPILSGIISGIIGGIVVSAISRSPLSVSGPAAGLTAICATAIPDTGSLQAFFLAVSLAGFIQMLTGIVKLGGFTHLIPSSVIKGMLAAIGILLISKQIPIIIGYDQPDFWRNEFFNIITFDHAFQHIDNLYHKLSAGSLLLTASCFIVLISWKKYAAHRISFIPTSFVTVLAGVLLAIVLASSETLRLSQAQYVTIPHTIPDQLQIPDFHLLFGNSAVWKYGIMIALVASLETLLSIEAIDKIDPQNRITPQNRELIAQGTGNILSGLFGGLPITAVIVRSAANAEAGARTRLSGIFHGVWLLLVILFAASVVNYIPYAVLAVILVRTGYNLAKPAMIINIYKQGKEQFLPFIVTIVAMLATDLLIGVLIGIVYSLYFLIRNTYKAGYTISENVQGHTMHVNMELALNVSFLNKRKIKEALDRIPPYSIVTVDGTKSIYIDHDILEIFQEYRTKARQRHVQLELKNIPEVSVIELH